MYQFTIKESEAGQRFNKYLQKLLPAAASSFLYKMLRKKNIELNGKKAAGNEVLKNGDTVRLFFSEETFLKFKAAGGQEAKSSSYEKAFQSLKGISVIYENEHMLLLNKPEGILTQKASDSDLSLNEWMIGYLLYHKVISEQSLQTFKPSVCNRLDRNTSGLIVAGKSLAGLQQMGELFKERTLKKYYLCIVKGRITEPAHISGYLVKDEKTNRVSFSNGTSSKEANGLPIETEYLPIAWNQEMTLLKVPLITGRTHQIRAHLAGTGHPLLGDYKYGSKKWNDRYKKEWKIKDQVLHAYQLTMPGMKKELENLSEKTFYAKVPETFWKLIKEMAWEHGTQEALEVLH